MYLRQFVGYRCALVGYALSAGHPQAMLTDIYGEAHLVDEDLADQVWEAWATGEIDDQMAWLAWCVVAMNPPGGT